MQGRRSGRKNADADAADADAADAASRSHRGRRGSDGQRLLRLLNDLLRLSLELSLLYDLLYGLHGDLQGFRLFQLARFDGLLLRFEQRIQLLRQRLNRLLRLHESQLRVLGLLRRLMHAQSRLLRQFRPFGRRGGGGVGAGRSRRYFMRGGAAGMLTRQRAGETPL